MNGDKSAPHGNTVVNFKLSEEREKIKKQAAKERRDLMRDRLRVKSSR